MKKIFFGILLVTIGLIFSSFCLFYAIMHPWDYNGITGLLGSFLGTYTLIPFLISFTVLLIGLIICWYETYMKK